MATLFEKLSPVKKSLVALGGLTAITIIVGAMPEASRLRSYSTPVPYPSLYEHISHVEQQMRGDSTALVNGIIGYGGALLITYIHNQSLSHSNQ